MDVAHHRTIFKKIKVFLVFFYGVLLFSCGERNASTIDVIYNDEKAIGVSVLLKGRTEGLSVYREDADESSILGEWQNNGEKYIFSPVIPFTPKERYIIKNDTEKLGSFSIGTYEEGGNPELLAMFPTTDTVPENLLKVYFAFSKPMQNTGDALNFISVIDETEKEEVSVFLQLHHELWNKNHDTLTLWLDPGRIKTDLIPNQKMGLPLQHGHTYTLKLSPEWKSSQGIPLKRAYTKHFYVTKRDSLKPETQSWKLKIPKQQTKNALEIIFDESMDAILARETLTVKNSNDNILKGTFELSKNERLLRFYPSQLWEAGAYTIIVDPILEDLAGNNLARLFDQDLSDVKKDHEFVDEHQLGFSIE